MAHKRLHLMLASWLYSSIGLLWASSPIKYLSLSQKKERPSLPGSQAVQDDGSSGQALAYARTRALPVSDGLTTSPCNSWLLLWWKSSEHDYLGSPAQVPYWSAHALFWHRVFEYMSYSNFSDFDDGFVRNMNHWQIGSSVIWAIFTCVSFTNLAQG